MKNIYVITGGTINYVRPHFALSAPAYGNIGREIANQLNEMDIQEDYNLYLIPTKMALSIIQDDKDYEDVYYSVLKKAGLDKLETNDELSKFTDYLISEKDTRCIVMSAAVCDFEPSLVTTEDELNSESFGKSFSRLHSNNFISLELKPSEKIISKIRKTRKDIFLVNFKTTSDVGFDETYKQGLSSLKKNSSNLVFANDIKQKINMVITPEEFPYHTDDRKGTIDILCKMLKDRLNLTFEDKTFLVDDLRAFPDKLVSDKSIPSNWYEVMTFLFKNNAFKPLSTTGKTSGHFGCRVYGKDYERITSERKINHNESFKRGMIRVYSYKDNKLMVGGAKPSVGEKTQEMIYHDLGDKIDAIVHFHSPLKDGVKEIPTKSQFSFECGSKECALNTVSGMKELLPGIWAVHLDNHGPNIAFSKDVKSEDVINFINKYWDITLKTGGIV